MYFIKLTHVLIIKFIFEKNKEGTCSMLHRSFHRALNKLKEKILMTKDLVKI